MTDNTPEARRDSDTDLAFDIGMALAKSKLTVKGQRIEACRIIADAVVAHLRLCRWAWRRLPPTAQHGSALPKREE